MQKTYSKQTAKFLAVVAENMPEISSERMQELIENPKALQKVLRDAFRLALLKLIGSFETPAIHFVAKDKFKINTSSKAEVKISHMSEDFKSLFVDGVAEDTEATTLNIHQLQQSSLDAPILAELGDRVPIKRGQLYEYLRTASREVWHVAYLVGNDGNLWAVYFRWGGGGWRLLVCSVESSDEWREGRRFVSR